MKENKVFILDVENTQVLPFLYYYRKLGYKVFAGSGIRFPIGFFSKFTQFKINTPHLELIEKKKKIRHFIKFIKETCKKYDINLILSFSEKMTKPLIEHKEELNIIDVFPSFTSYEILYDKSILKKYLEKIGVRNFYIPKSFDSTNVLFPCVVKPNIGGGGMYISICNNRHELIKSIRKIELVGRKPIIEEYIPFEDRFAMNILIDRNYRIKRVVTRKLKNKKEMLKIIYELEKFFRRIRYFGFASPQFLLKDNKLYLTEINPRLSAVPFGTDLNINFPEAFHKAIIEGNNIKKKFIFLPKNFPWRKPEIHFIIYKKKYRDYLPLLIWLNQYFKAMTKHNIKLIFSSDYRKWIKIFKSIKSDESDVK
jgi:predicted ATP-grasp superfamily ATP-dependent carboligase